MNIVPRCACGGKLRVDASVEATTIHIKKCRACGARWRVVAKPQRSKREGVQIHVVELLLLQRSTKWERMES